MARVFEYSSVSPNVQFYNNSHEFEKKLLKTSTDVSDGSSGSRNDGTLAGLMGKRKYEGIEQLKAEIHTGKSFNNKQQCEFLVNKLPGDKTVYHQGYLEYLLASWHNDCGTQCGPWDLWTIILHQFNAIIQKNPERYAKIFTKSGKSHEIRLNKFNMDEFLSKVKEMIPFDMSLFFPNFDKNSVPANYIECLHGQFAEIVSEYYPVIIYTCIIPKVRVVGSESDWQALLNAIKNINQLFVSNGIPIPYISRCIDVIQEFIDNLNNAEFWKDFFSVKDCGCGRGAYAQEQVQGHVTKLLECNREVLTQTMPKIISRFSYTDADIKKQCYMISGCMFSTLDGDNILVPEYHTNISYLDRTQIYLSEQQIQERKKLLVLFQKLDYFWHTYYDNHFMITRKTLNIKDDFKLQLHQTPEFKDYVKKTPRYSNESEQYYRARVTREYTNLKTHNECENKMITDAKFDIDRYIELKNEQRREILKTQFNVWKPIDVPTRDEVFNLKLTQEMYDQQYEKHKALFNEIQENVPILMDFIRDNNYMGVWRRLIQTYNTGIYEDILNHYRRNPFQFYIEDDSCSVYDLDTDGNETRFGWKKQINSEFDLFFRILYSMHKRLEPKEVGDASPSYELSHNIKRKLMEIRPEFAEPLLDLVAKGVKRRIIEGYKRLYSENRTVGHLKNMYYSAEESKDRLFTAFTHNHGEYKYKRKTTDETGLINDMLIFNELLDLSGKNKAAYIQDISRTFDQIDTTIKVGEDERIAAEEEERLDNIRDEKRKQLKAGSKERTERNKGKPYLCLVQDLVDAVNCQQSYKEYTIDELFHALNFGIENNESSKFVIHDGKIYVKIVLDFDVILDNYDLTDISDIGEGEKEEIKKCRLASALNDYDEEDGDIAEFLLVAIGDILGYQIIEGYNVVDVRFSDFKRLYDGYKVDVEPAMPNLDIALKNVFNDQYDNFMKIVMEPIKENDKKINESDNDDENEQASESDGDEHKQ
jgi:hypothetical protein